MACGRAPFRIWPTEGTPPSVKRVLQRRIVSEATSLRLAISSLATPSAAHSNARDCTTARRGNCVERAITSSA
jgi:hypothetical protein